MTRASFPIPSPPTWMPCAPRCCRRLLAAASRNAARGFANLQLFEIGAAFDSGMPEAQKTVAAAIRTGHPERHWQKGGDDTGLFAVKADLLAALEAITGAPMSAPDHPRRPRLVSSRPQRHHRHGPQESSPSSASCIPRCWPRST